MMRTILLITFGLFYSSSFSQTINTDAPSVSAGATTVGKRVFQLETRFQYTKSEFIEQFQLPSNLFRLGLGENFELRMINGINVSTHSSGHTNVNLSRFLVGMKAQLLNNPEKKTQIAFLAHAAIPKFEVKGYHASGTFAFNHQLNKRNSIGYNLGYSFTSFNKVNQTHTIDASLIYSNNITSKLSVFAEFYGGYVDNVNFNLTEGYLNFDTGFLYLLKDNIQLDYSFGLGIVQSFSFHAIGINFMIDGKRRD